jgi:hypothetical protein
LGDARAKLMGKGNFLLMMMMMLLMITIYLPLTGVIPVKDVTGTISKSFVKHLFNILEKHEIK